MIDYLITGGKGFIGKNLVKKLEKQSSSYKIIDVNGQDDATCSCFDISAYHLPKIKCDKVVHLAAATNVRDSVKSPVHYINQNCSGILNILEFARENKVSEVTFTSSASAETAMSPYLASKAACESVCKAFDNTYGLNVKVLKLSSVYGPHSEHKKSVIAKFIKACFEGRPLEIFGSGDQKRDFIYVEDVVDAILSGKSGFISTGVATSVRQLAHMISDLSVKYLNHKPMIHFEQPVAGEVINPVLHSDIFVNWPLKEGLEKTFKWYKENYSAAK